MRIVPRVLFCPRVHPPAGAGPQAGANGGDDSSTDVASTASDASADVGNAEAGPATAAHHHRRRHRQRVWRRRHREAADRKGRRGSDARDGALLEHARARRKGLLRHQEPGWPRGVVSRQHLGRERQDVAGRREHARGKPGGRSRRHPDAGHDVFCGRGVGGGSLVNMAMLVTPPQDVLQAVLPSVDAAQMLSTYYPRALAVLKANMVSLDFFSSTPWYEYARVGHSAARRRASTRSSCLPATTMRTWRRRRRAQVPASALDDEAGFGNNYGKQSLDKTYIADAIATGNLTIESLCIVKEIQRNPGRHLSRRGQRHRRQRQADGAEGGDLQSALLVRGSHGTSQLLVRARDTGALPDLNDQVGTGWGPNSDIFLMRSNTNPNPRGRRCPRCPRPASVRRTRTGRRCSRWTSRSPRASRRTSASAS